MLKHLKHHWKRAASGLMALVMAAGLLPGTSLAAKTAATPVIQTEAAYNPTGNFELSVAGTTAWNGGEEPLTVYSTQAGTTQVTEIPAGEPFALLEDSGGARLTISYSEDGWTGGTLEDTGWVDKADVLVNLPDLIPSIAYVREDAVSTSSPVPTGRRSAWPNSRPRPWKAARPWWSAWTGKP